MKKILIENAGVVVPEAFSLIGASTKRGDKSKIGMFGSGNKYAIACFMRNDINFEVYSGGKKIDFTLQKATFNEHDFQVILIDGHKTSITTEMGFKWTLWQALREFYSNACDEGLIDFRLIDTDKEVLPTTEDSTLILIDFVPDLEEIWYNIGDYFARDKKVLFAHEPTGKIYQKTSGNTNVYRKGIRCYDTKKVSLFDYDLNLIQINESRIVEHSWELPEYIWKLLYRCDNAYVLRTILSRINEANILEANIDDSFVSTYSQYLSDTWKEAIGSHKICPKSMSGYLDDEDRAKTYILPTRLYLDLVAKFGEEMETKAFKTTEGGHYYKSVSPDDLHLEILKEVERFFEECGFEQPFPIDIVDFNVKGVHGGVDKKTILIDKRAFEQGKDWIASIIIEEFIHIKHQAQDETRHFQNVLIAELITYMKKRNSYNL